MLSIYARHSTQRVIRYTCHPYSSFAVFRQKVVKVFIDFASRQNSATALREAQAPATSHSFSVAELTTVMSAVNDPDSHSLMQRIFNDLRKSGFSLHPTHYHLALVAMAKSPDIHPKYALEFIANSPPTIPVRPMQNVLLDTYLATCNINALFSCVEITGVDREFLSSAHLALFRAILASTQPPATGELENLWQNMKKKRVQTTYTLVDAIAQTCRKLSVRPPDFLKQKIRRATEFASWGTWIDRIDKAPDLNSKMSIVTAMKRDQHVPDASVLALLIRDVDTAEDLVETGIRLGVIVKESHWETVIKNASRTRGPSLALETYEYAKRVGIEPTVKMVISLVTSLVSPHKSMSNWQSLSQAMNLYRDVAHIHLTRVYSNAILHRTILQALSSSNVPQALEYRKEVLDTMERNGVTISTKDAVALSLRTIYGAQSHIEALANLRKARILGDLSHHEFIEVLECLCEQAYPESTIIPPVVFFDFIREIVWNGHPLQARVYSTVFNRYLALAKTTHCAMPAVDVVLLRRYISECHHRLIMDTSLKADNNLSSCIMTSYLHVNDFMRATDMFKQLLNSRAVTPASISSVFDACGFGQRLDIALEILAELTRIGYDLGPRNRMALLECFGRCGDIERAVAFLLKNERDGSENAVNATSLVLKFASQHQLLESRVYAQIRRGFPKTFQMLSHLRSPIAHRARRRGLVPAATH